MADDDRDRLAARYRRFADDEARGRSPSYEAITSAIAGDRQTLDFLLGLPEKRQPNLLLAAVRHLFGAQPDWDQFQATLMANTDAIRALVLARSTQTNEPARCAVLLPILSRLPQPIALVEVGASAGLCLLPDFYGYDYGRRAGTPAIVDRGADVPLPGEHRHAVARSLALHHLARGLDLNPIDASDRAQAAWLETLVWPEQADRGARLRSALKVAALQKPRVDRGDLLGEKLAELCALAPKSATLVVFHTAVLGYVSDRAQRQRFADTARTLCPCWISNEAPRVFPEHAKGAGDPPSAGHFLMAVNGAPVAWTDPHGASLQWIADPAL